MVSAIGGTNGTDGMIHDWLSWYMAMGVDCCMHDLPIAYDMDNRGSGRTRDLPDAAPSQQNTRSQSSREQYRVGPPADGAAPRPAISSEAVTNAQKIAASCNTLDDIGQALATFDGCALKRTANRLCFGDGNPNARIMFIGEAPGAQEDRQGKPFVGPSGQLLGRMLACIGLERSTIWITNSIFWRPPGNRTPTDMEIAICQPFLERQIEVLDPEVLVFVGGTAARTLLGVKEGVTRLRGRRMHYSVGTTGRNIPSIVMFHPAYLLRQPLKKKETWNDLLTIGEWLENVGRRSIH